MALEMVYPEPEPSPVEKMLIFIEKISQSGGVGKIVMRTGNNRIANSSNFIEVFKEMYPGYFGENDENYEENNKDDFASLLKFNNNNNENENGDGNINEYENIENNENIYENEDKNNKIEEEKINSNTNEIQL